MQPAAATTRSLNGGGRFADARLRQRRSFRRSIASNGALLSGCSRSLA
jgi:hypothetical protein